MILIASLEKIGETYNTSSGHHALKCKFEHMTGCPVLVQHYSQITAKLVDALPVDAIFITGTSVPWSEVDVKDLYGFCDFVRDTEIPIHGACGGHQLLGIFFNNDLRTVDKLENNWMRKLHPNEPDSMPDYHPGWFTESGVWPVQIIAADPIFEGFDDSLMVREAHAGEIKTLPPDFVHLARNDNCEIQAMRHKDRPIYGTQFHPEAWNDDYPDGKRFMENFFRIAGLIQ
jgi:GMP synthase (glutamine-hydrolysing)